MRDAPGYDGGARGARAAAVPLTAADCPLEAMREEHFRQRQFCIDMETLAGTDVPRPGLALALLVNLCRDRPLHHRDEDEGLFPRLSARALPEDEIAPLLARLSQDHAAGGNDDLMAALACMADGALPAPEDRAALRAQALAERRHMTIENAIVLPLAQLRLTDPDKAALLGEMRARRDMGLPATGPCARVAGGVPALAEGKHP